MVIHNEYLSTIELAVLLGVSRITIFRNIKSGKIPAIKVGRNYIISKKDIIHLIEKKKKDGAEDEEITKAVKKVVEDYGETLRLLGED